MMSSQMEAFAHPVGSSAGLLSSSEYPSFEVGVGHLYHHTSQSFDAQCPKEGVFPWVKQLSLAKDSFKRWDSEKGISHQNILWLDK